MPLTTHFYINYCVMQPLTHGMNLTRYISMIKYFIWKNACGHGKAGGGRSEGARFKSEPEDQDYYGIGSRSARFAFMLLVGLVFGTICPLMIVIVAHRATGSGPAFVAALAAVPWLLSYMKL